MDDLVHWSIMLGVTPLALDLAGRLVMSLTYLFWGRSLSTAECGAADKAS